MDDPKEMKPVNRVAQALTEKLLDLVDYWASLQPLKPEIERAFWKKLRLDWNYNSNHIEGNTLTYGETELLLIHGQTQGNHHLREYEEMKAHDVAIARLRELAAEKRPLNEAEIRMWNGIILKEPFWTSAITPDGQATRKQVVPGQNKTSANSVRTATGEIFEFASPMEVPAKMGGLVARLNEISGAPLSEWPERLARTHHEFLIIHPFDDGNGRVARLILNYLLMCRGLVPIIIPTEDKKTYQMALQQADAGMFEGLTAYVSERMVAALNSALDLAA